jgi:hypothetical protein
MRTKKVSARPNRVAREKSTFAQRAAVRRVQPMARSALARTQEAEATVRSKNRNHGSGTMKSLSRPPCRTILASIAVSRARR